MKFPKLQVFSKLLCASALSSYLTFAYLSIQTDKQQMATKSCAENCRSTAQKLRVFCPEGKGTFIVTGNWKMNGDKKMAEELLKILRCGPILAGNQVIIGVPAPYLDYVQQRKPKSVEVAAQNIYKESKGAFTGEISADMILDIGAKWVILGASERRILFHEDYNLIGEKAKYALDKGLNVILCLGETAEQRDCNNHVSAVIKQLATVMEYVEKSKWKNVVIAYEPLWTIGTGRTATPDDAQEMAKAIRKFVADRTDRETAAHMRIQYGGPLLPSAKAFAAQNDINGLYVGAPSLKPDFIGLINANGK